MYDTKNTVGVVETKIAKIPLPEDGFKLECGRSLKELQVAYETYGTLTPAKDNVVFICHALSGDAHVAGWHGKIGEGAPGWWENMVGPGKGIDTNHYFVVCANILGGCKGTTGPSSINPETGKPYGSDFPPITVRDVVRVHSLLTRYLGLEKIAVVVGGSFGGMQALEWLIQEPDRVENCICIASATALSAQALAFDIVGRRAIMADPNWEGGDYYESGQVPSEGLSLARKIGHITYLSPEMMGKKFGREKYFSDNIQQKDNLFISNFQVESYLEHQGEKFVDRFDANSYLHITRMMDEYDIEAIYGNLENAFSKIKGKVLVVALSSDWLFPPEQSAEIANRLLKVRKKVSYCCISAPHGHDAFLVDVKNLFVVVNAFMPWVGKKPTIAKDFSEEFRNSTLFKAYKVIEQWVTEYSQIVDIGCGNGILMDLLTSTKKVSALGIDISIDNVIEVINKGYDIFQADVDEGLAMIPDKTYDFAILSDTLQVVKNPRLILNEMVRVAREGIVSFPNFGKLSHRFQLLLKGRMPKSRELPFEWYETPNIHLFTRQDFIDLCVNDDIKIVEMVCIPDCTLDRMLVRAGLCNLGAARVVARISKENNVITNNGCKDYK